MTRWLLVLPLLLGHRLAAADAPPEVACHERAADSKIAMTFAPDVSVADLATWLTGTTCKNVVFDSSIAKRALKVTIVAPNKYTPKQAVQLVVDAIEATGLVVTQKPDTFIVKLGPTMPKTCPDVAVAPSAPVADPHDPAADALTAALDTGIKKLDDTHSEVTKAVVDAVLANPMAVAKGARVVPAIKDGKPVGFKLYAIRPSSVFSKLGFANGDTVVSINGLVLTSADKALEIYAKLRDAKRLEIELVRRSKPVQLVITIK